MKLDTTQLVFINYHPGLDWCNTSGAATKKTMNSWFKTLSKKLRKYTSNSIIHILKDSAQILEKDSGLGYKYDHSRVIENLFFKHHYPCGSFLLIDFQGNYITYFGEYGKEQVIEKAKVLLSKSFK